MDSCVEDLKESFMISIKKAIVDFVLKDPSQKEALITTYTRDQLEMKEMAVRDNWKNVITVNSRKMTNMLHVINPCVAQLLDLWYVKYRKLRLVDVDYFSQRTFSLGDFDFAVSRQLENCQRILMLQYYVEVQNIFMQGSKKGKLPDPGNKRRMERFYNCVAAIMSHQLQTLCMKSLYEYTNYLLDVGYANKGFEIHITHRNNLLTFEPSFNKFTEVLVGTYDRMIKALLIMPRLETKLYLDYEGDPVIIKVRSIFALGLPDAPFCSL